MKKLIIFEIILIIFFVSAWNVSKADECRDEYKAYLKKNGDTTYYREKAHSRYMECLSDDFSDFADKNMEKTQKILDSALETLEKQQNNNSLPNPKNFGDYEPSKSTDEIKEKLQEVKELYEDGIINEKEYEKLRSKIISSYN